jgi:hypothetical protein
MSSPRSWFLQGPMQEVIDVGKVITLKHPTLSTWRILEVLHEHEYHNYESHGDLSYAAIELSCNEVGGLSRQSRMRIVIQIPHFGTKHKNSDVRAKQATRFRTEELLAFMTFAKKGSKFIPPFPGYGEDRQDRSGLVPGGFSDFLCLEVCPWNTTCWLCWVCY